MLFGPRTVVCLASLYSHAFWAVCGYVRKGSYITDIGVYFEQTDTLQLPHMQAHGVPHLARLVGYEIHCVQTCTSVSTYAYS